MSSISEEEESGPTLRELVTKTLEANGVLGKLQAQLRASVFHILEEECKEKNIPLINQKAKQMLSTPSGKIAVALIQDFLQCLSLDFSLAVFNPESNSDATESLGARKSLEEKFGCPEDKVSDSYPLLLHLIDDIKSGQNGKYSEKILNGVQNFEQDTSKHRSLTSTSSSTHTNGHSSSMNGKVSNDGEGKLESNGHGDVHHSSAHSDSAGQSDKEESSVSSVKTTTSTPQSEKDTLAGLEKEYEEEFSSLSNVNNLPAEEEKESSVRSDKEQSASHKTVEKETNSEENTITEEIDPDFDDLLSSHSESNRTKDYTVSSINANVADYQESL